MKKGIDKTGVVSKACSLVDREGIEALSLARLASELGIRTPSLYNHVTSLADLKRAIAVVGIEELNDALRAAMVGRSGAEALRAGATAFRSFVLGNPGKWQTLCALPGKEVEGDHELATGSERLMTTLAAGLESFRFSRSDLVHAVRSLRSLIHGFTSLELSHGFGMPIDVDESFAWLLETFLRGLQRPVS